MKDIVVVFARAPRLGTVKRRLAGAIGDRAALRLYRRMLDAVLRRLAADRRFQTVVAVTPDRATGPWLRQLPAVAQGRGGLDRRMAAAFQRWPRRRVALVGSDIPGLLASDAAAAFRGLGRAQAVFGPARDGGYWLVAMGPRRPAAPFAGVRWSTQWALEDTLANFAGRSTARLRTLSDLDTADDLPSACLEVLLQARHQFHQVARAEPGVELPDQDVVPGVAHRPGAAG